MIALNDLLDRIDLYENMYQKMNFYFEKEYIVGLEAVRKEKQLEFEHSRADCNKLCHLLAVKKGSNQDFSLELEKILYYEKFLNESEDELNELGTKINDYLMTLPNLPDEFVLNDIVIFDSKNDVKVDLTLAKNELIKYLINLDKFSVYEFNGELKSYLKSISSTLLSQSDAYRVVKCLDGLILLCPEFEINRVRDALIQIKELATKIVRVNTKSNEKSSTDEYLVYFGEQFIKMSLKREFFTREHCIKYRNKQVDMTKFVNEIDIIF